MILSYTLISFKNIYESSNREWIEIDSDFQKYVFVNVEINPFQS